MKLIFVIKTSDTLSFNSRTSKNSSPENVGVLNRPCQNSDVLHSLICVCSMTTLWQPAEHTAQQMKTKSLTGLPLLQNINPDTKRITITKAERKLTLE